MNSNSFIDVYFGEIMSLWHDIRSVPKLKDKIGYVFMPPGWSHTGKFETAKTLRTQAIKELKK